MNLTRRQSSFNMHRLFADTKFTEYRSEDIPVYFHLSGNFTEVMQATADIQRQKITRNLAVHTRFNIMQTFHHLFAGWLSFNTPHSTPTKESKYKNSIFDRSLFNLYMVTVFKSYSFPTIKISLLLFFAYQIVKRFIHIFKLLIIFSFQFFKLIGQIFMA